MNLFLKRWAITVIALVTMSVAVCAQQKGDKAVGVDLVVNSAATGDEEFVRVGLSGKFKYNVSDPLRVEGVLTLFAKQEYATTFDLSVNAHWLIPVAGDKLFVYPLAGLGAYTVRYSGDGYSDSESRIGINIGGGADFKVNDRLSINYEYKYKVISLEESYFAKISQISIGVAIKF